jgi:hypothetical protein
VGLVELDLFVCSSIPFLWASGFGYLGRFGDLLRLR